MHDGIGDKTFGQYLTAVMRDRGFKSDEQLARRAAKIQNQLTPPINVQRRTINNWRNDKTTPRDINDPKFKLIAHALSLSEEEIANFAHLIEHKLNKRFDSETILKTKKPIKKQFIISTMALSAIFISVLFLNFMFLRENQLYVQFIPPTQLRLSINGFVIDNSDTRVVSERDLEHLSGWELYVARNEIFARKGRPFVKDSSICLQKHFDSWAKGIEKTNGWYQKRSGDIRLSDLEYRNAETIRNYECTVRGGQYTCNGRLNQCL